MNQILKSFVLILLAFGLSTASYAQKPDANTVIGGYNLVTGLAKVFDNSGAKIFNQFINPNELTVNGTDYTVTPAALPNDSLEDFTVRYRTTTKAQILLHVAHVTKGLNNYLVFSAALFADSTQAMKAKAPAFDSNPTTLQFSVARSLKPGKTITLDNGLVITVGEPVPVAKPKKAVIGDDKGGSIAIPNNGGVKLPEPTVTQTVELPEPSNILTVTWNKKTYDVTPGAVQAGGNTLLQAKGSSFLIRVTSPDSLYFGPTKPELYVLKDGVWKSVKGKNTLSFTMVPRLSTLSIGAIQALSFGDGIVFKVLGAPEPTGENSQILTTDKGKFVVTPWTTDPMVLMITKLANDGFCASYRFSGWLHKDQIVGLAINSGKPGTAMVTTSQR